MPRYSTYGIGLPASTGSLATGGFQPPATSSGAVTGTASSAACAAAGGAGSVGPCEARRVPAGVDSKDAILFECVRIGLELLQNAIREADAAGGRAIDKLIAAMRQYVGIVTMDFGMCVIRVGEDPLPPDRRQKLRRMKADLDLEFRALIRQAIAEGSILPCDPKVAAFTVAGALSWVGRWYRPDGGLAPADIATQCIAVLTRGLCSPSYLASIDGPE